MSQYVTVSGVWIRRDFPHLGGKLTVLVEVDGQWRALGTWEPDTHISHIFEPAGITNAPVDHSLDAYR